MKKKIDAKELVKDIVRLAREKVSSQNLVSFDHFKELNNKSELKTILVIEDDEIMRRSLHRIFEADGYRVLSARDGVELANVLFDTVIDLILLDVGLPWVNGFELAGLMKQHEELKNVPVVFISGHGDQADIKKGFSVGADDYITKPFDVVKIRKTIRTLLELQE